MAAQTQRELGPVEVFFGNGGVARGGDPLTTPAEVWNDQWQTNVSGMSTRYVLCCQYGLFENEKVRVLEYVSRPGIGVCGTGRHSHPDHVTVTLTPAKVKLTTADGKVQLNSIPAGSAYWQPASTHSAENIGGSGSRMVLIEIKDKDWKPASG